MRTKEDWLNFRKQQKAIEENTLIEWSIEDEEENHIEKNDDTQTEEATPEKTPKTAGRKADTRTLPELLIENQDVFIEK